MQITIDTQKESKEELRKTAKFLLGLAGDESYPENTDFESTASPAMFSMFGDDSDNSDSSNDKKDDDFGYSSSDNSDSSSDDSEDKKPPRIEIIEY